MELPAKLSASDSSSFAYQTIKDRVPQILTKIIDTCHQHIKVVQSLHGEDGAEDVKNAIGKLSQMRNELMTDKPITKIEDDMEDTKYWNQYIKKLKNNNKVPSWFTESWLFVECYFYRKVMSILHVSKYLKDFDPFLAQKNKGLNESLPAVDIYLKYLSLLISSKENLKQNFISVVLISLWGNKFDLSLSGGTVESNYGSDPVAQVHSLDSYILVNDTEKAFNLLLSKIEKEHTRVDMVIDNAGFELCSDLIFAEFILSKNLADSVQFHPKTIPWFVSDVTYSNFHDTLLQLACHKDQITSQFGKKWQSRLKDGSFKLAFENDTSCAKFWTYPNGYCDMKNIDVNLYNELSKSDLIIFKGDLNYRKLLDDRSWPCETPFDIALQGFTPSPLVCLRTLKADVVVGLKPGQKETAESNHPDWMVTGSYAVINYQS